MNDHQFEALMQMHRDTLGAIKDVRNDLGVHVKDDQAIHAVVSRHTTYWKAVSGTLSALVAGVAAHLSWK